jgi:molecular chaperone HscB
VTGDPFAALGLPRAQALDLAEAERRFRERMREVHPDRAPAADRARAAALAAEVAAAWRTLRDPLERAAALLRLAGCGAVDAPDAGFLSRQFALRERLAAGDPSPREEARRGLAEEEARLAARRVPGAPPADLDSAARALVRARFHAALTREVRPA